MFRGLAGGDCDDGPTGFRRLCDCVIAGCAGRIVAGVSAFAVRSGDGGGSGEAERGHPLKSRYLREEI